MFSICSIVDLLLAGLLFTAVRVSHCLRVTHLRGSFYVIDLYIHLTVFCKWE